VFILSIYIEKVIITYQNQMLVILMIFSSF